MGRVDARRTGESAEGALIVVAVSRQTAVSRLQAGAPASRLQVLVRVLHRSTAEKPAFTTFLLEIAVDVTGFRKFLLGRKRAGLFRLDSRVAGLRLAVSWDWNQWAAFLHDPATWVTIVASIVNWILRYCWRVLADKLRDAITSEVARIIREERTRRGLSLNGLAERAGLSRQMVSYVEQEERNPSLDTLLRIAEVLEIPLDALIQRARLAASSRTRG